jgi:hypothetical protein
VIDDAVYRQQQQRIADLVTRLRHELGLYEGWDVALQVVQGEIEDGTSAYATILVHWQYREAILIVSAMAVSGISDEKLERILLHELMHIFLDMLHPAGREMTDAESDKEERVATDLAFAIQRMLSRRLAAVLDQAELASRRAQKKIKALEHELEAERTVA